MNPGSLNYGSFGGSATAVTTRRGLRDLLESGARCATPLTGPVLVSSTIPVPWLDPLDFFERGRALAGERGFWRVPERDFAIAGVGVAWSITARGQRRFTHVGRAWQGLLSDALIDVSAQPPESACPAGPLLMGGFAFDPLRAGTGAWRGYPDALLFLPKYTLTAVHGTAWFTVNALVHPGADPSGLAEAAERDQHVLLAGDPESDGASRGGAVGAGAEAMAGDVPPPLELKAGDPAAWMARVAELAGQVRSGRLEKVVLAREVRARAARPFSATAVLRALAHGNLGGYHFAVAQADGCFLGASPEQLVELKDGDVRTMCLAGSIARGAAAEEDRHLGQALLTSAKDRAEHAVVVAALRDGLAPVCSDLHVADEPGLLKLRHVQHLFTPVTGRVNQGRTILDVLERIHPTPAVGGFPREAALELIRAREGLDRGWYAGPVGWIDRFGEGEFAVAIRSALLRGDEASLFAGCGIMGDSDPESEFRESCLKLKGMRCALERSLR